MDLPLLVLEFLVMVMITADTFGGALKELTSGAKDAVGGLMGDEMTASAINSSFAADGG